jgi:hypothetical protein
MPQSSVMQKVSSDIKAHGWHVLSVFGKDLPNFSYTIGFTETLNHPEIVISGLESKLAHLLLNDIGNLIINGHAFKNGDFSDQILKNYPVKFETVRNENISEYFAAANNHYGAGKFKALQCIWPDRDGNFQEATNEVQEILS